HLRSLPRRTTTELQRTGRDLDSDIVQIKEMLRDVVTQRKRAWTARFPYPCRTSTHYYLSGIRFYSSPMVEHTGRARLARARAIGDTDRFSVPSMSSGLFPPSERDGCLIPGHASTKRRADVAAQLLCQVPIGALALGLMDDVPTPADRKAAKHY